MGEQPRVPTSGDVAHVEPLAAPDRRHREAFVRYVLEHAAPWHREHLGHLYKLWRVYNTAYFDDEMVEPYMTLSEPSNPRRVGDCGAVSGFGGGGQIRIRPSLLVGTYARLNSNEHGRVRFVADVLLHEMIHQWQYEVVGRPEKSYHGHGTYFRNKANEIGAKLALERVRSNRTDGKDRDLPICSKWPHLVRPKGYYLGAYDPVPTSGDVPKRVMVYPSDLERTAGILLEHFDVDELCRELGEASQALRKEQHEPTVLQPARAN